MTGIQVDKMQRLVDRFCLAHKTAIVTGGSSGIGRAIAESMAEAGASVMIVGRDPHRLSDAERAIDADGGSALSLQVDLGDDGAPMKVVNATLAAFRSIDILVHAAGIFDPRPFSETAIETFDAQWSVNVRACYQLSQAVVPHLQSGSSIIFLSSIAGHIGFPNATAYCATKGAVELLVKALAVELAPRGIRVNAIAPGNIRTPMNEHLLANAEYERSMIASTPLRTIGSVDHVAPLAVLLASAAGSYIVGASIPVDGGWTAT